MIHQDYGPNSLPILLPPLPLQQPDANTPPLGLEPTFAVGPTSALIPAPDPEWLVFSTHGCTGCRTIEGTSTATIGPDLTHIATAAAT